MSRGERRLAAIMFTDMVGYTTLGQRNESLSLVLVEEQRNLIRPILARHNGREVKTIGDAFLVEFPSALDAVRCAYDIQRTAREFNISMPEERRVHLRVGVHLGDVVESSGDLSGDAVNVASRIEPLAEDGGVCITRQVYDHVQNKFELTLVSLGSKSLKNVSSPLEVYRMVMPWTEEKVVSPTQQDKRRIAVLPFANISPDRADEYFAEGMTEELINTISHNHQLRVIARTSVGRFKGSTKSVSEIGKEVGVGSILEGSVRKAGNKIRVTAQLIDAATEEHLWSDNYDRQMDDVFSIQSEIANSVSEALMVELIPDERKRIERGATRSSAAYIRYLKGRIALRDRTENKMREAKRFFEDAIAEDKDYAEAYAGLADALFLLSDRNYLPKAEAKAKGQQALDRALSLDDGLAEAHTSLASYLMDDYKFAEAESEFKKAIFLNPSYALAHHWLGIYMMEVGRPEDYLKEMLRAEELDPLSSVIESNLVFAYAFFGDKGETENRIRKLKELDPTEEFMNVTFAWVSEQLNGDFEGASVHMEKALGKDPTKAEYISSLGFYSARAGRRDKALDLLKALDGLPEGTFAKPFHLAMVYAGLEQRDAMFRCLEQAFEERSLHFRDLRYSRFNPDIRKDARYTALFQRAKLQP